MGTNTQLNTTTIERPNPDELLAIFDVTKEEATIFKLDYISSMLNKLEAKVQDAIDKTPKGRLQKYKHQIKHLKLQLDDLQHSKGVFIGIKVNSTDVWQRELVQLSINKVNEEIETIERRLRYLKSLTKPISTDPSKPQRPAPIDLDAIKEQIKIKDLLLNHGIKITWNNFFALRNEKTPSCQFNEKKNLWHDFGDTSKGGSVLDLYMALNNCSLREAIKSLGTLL